MSKLQADRRKGSSARRIYARETGSLFLFTRSMFGAAAKGTTTYTTKGGTVPRLFYGS